MPAPNALAQTPLPLPAVENGTQFLVFFRSQPVGREEVLILKVADGWIVKGTSRLGAPIDITTRVAEIDYDLQWRPKSLLVDGRVARRAAPQRQTWIDPVDIEPAPRAPRVVDFLPQHEVAAGTRERTWRTAGSGHR